MQFWEIIYLYKGLFKKFVYFICQTILLPMHCTVLPIKVGNVVTLKTYMQENFYLATSYNKYTTHSHFHQKR